MNIYACIINLQVPHEVKNQRAVDMRTPQIMQKGQELKYPKWEVVLGAPDKVNIPASVN